MDSDRRFQICIFDMDGTLTDSKPGIISSMQYALDKLGIELTDEKQLDAAIGPPLYDTLRQRFGLDDETARRGVGFYRERFVPIGMYENSVFPGAAQMLERLHTEGVRIMLATSKPQTYAQEILQHFGLLQYFDMISGALLDESRNKKIDVLGYLLQQIEDFDTHRCVMVGDRYMDIQAARQLGLFSVGVSWGYSQGTELYDSGADRIVHSMQELTSGLLGGFECE